MADTQNTSLDYLSQNEVRKQIPGYEGLYSISNFGKIWRDDKVSWGDPIPSGRLLKPWLTRNGYLWIQLGQHKQGRHAIHYLVAITFLGPKPHGYVVNHKDACKTNNHVSNLEYMTHQENSAHAARLGRFTSGDDHWTRKSPEKILRGERHWSKQKR